MKDKGKEGRVDIQIKFLAAGAVTPALLLSAER